MFYRQNHIETVWSDYASEVGSLFHKYDGQFEFVELRLSSNNIMASQIFHLSEIFIILNERKASEDYKYIEITNTIQIADSGRVTDMLKQFDDYTSLFDVDISMMINDEAPVKLLSLNGLLFSYIRYMGVSQLSQSIISYRDTDKWSH